MPQLGETVLEAVVTRWLKKEGEPVEQDESLVEVSTDKVDSEIPSPASGRLSRILAKEGETVLIGAPLAEIDDQAGGEAAAKAAPAAKPHGSPASPEVSAPPSAAEPKAPPQRPEERPAASAAQPSSQPPI
ncbi:MAG: dihydrolipoamide succinyltransferase, partial [Actinomycetota bacterium]|nr:dihydrolipoamide succinyltransferase [Actinomycetota bacterium]